LTLGVIVLALGTGIGSAVLLVLLRSEVISVRQLREHFDVPVLGSVSLLQSPAQRGMRAIEISSFGAIAGVLVILGASLYHVYASNPVPPQLRLDPSAWRTAVVEQLSRIR
jgi:hypothetical protein